MEALALPPIRIAHGGVHGDLEAASERLAELIACHQQALARRQEEADRLRRQHVERAKYEAELAQRRFLKVDPDNRLVADALEADWNAKLRTLAAAQETYEKAAAADVTSCRGARLIRNVRPSEQWNHF